MNAYDVFVRISMQNGVSGVLNVIQRDVMGLHTRVDMLAGRFNMLKVAIGGAMLVGAGMGLGAMILHASKSADKYVSQLQQMKAAGFTPAELAASEAAAHKTSSSVLTATPLQNLERITEMRLAFAGGQTKDGKPNNMAATMEAIHNLEAVQTAVANLIPRFGAEGAAKQAFALVTALEEIGAAKDPKRFGKILDQWTRDIVVANGKLTGQDFQQNTKYMRGAAMYADDEFLMYHLPALAQALKTGGGSGAGGGAGNPLATLFANVVGGQMTKRAFEAFNSLGLIKPGMVEFEKGKFKGVKPGGVVGSDVAAVNLVRWVDEVLAPKIGAKKLTEQNADGSYKHVAELAGFMGHMFPARLANAMATMIIQQRARIMVGDPGLFRASQDTKSSYAEQIRKNPVLAWDAVISQWERLMTLLGTPISLVKGEVFYQLAEALNYLGNVVKHHPRITKFAMYGAAILAGIMIVVGAIGIFVAAMAILGTGSAFWMVLIVGVGAALYAITKMIQQIVENPIWNAVGEWTRRAFNSVMAWPRQASDYIHGAIVNIGGYLGNLWQEVCAALVVAVGHIGDELLAMPGKLWQWFKSGLNAANGMESVPRDPSKQSGQLDPNYFPQSYVPPAADNNVRVENIMYLDGDPVYRSVIKRFSRDGSRPPSTTSRPDGRLHPLFPADVVPA